MNIPFVAMTAHAMNGDKEFFLNAGLDEYIFKPIDRNKLDRVISRAMSMLNEAEARTTGE